MNDQMILPLDLIDLIFKEIDSFGLILSLTCKQYHSYFKEKKIMVNIDELLISITVPLIEFMKNFKIIRSNKKYLCQKIAKCGKLDILQWACKNGFPWSEGTYESAALKGHLEVLKWARENGCPWDEWTCRNAAKGGTFRSIKMGT